MTYSSDIRSAFRTSLQPDAANCASVWSWVPHRARLLETFGNRLPSFAFAIVVLVLMWFSIRFSHGGYAHPEGELYLPTTFHNSPCGRKSTTRTSRDRSFLSAPSLVVCGRRLRRGISRLVNQIRAPSFSFRKLLRVLGRGLPLAMVLLSTTSGCEPLDGRYTDFLVMHRFCRFISVGYFRSTKAGATFFMLSAFIVLSDCFRLRLRSLSKFSAAALAIAGGTLLLCACLFDEIPVGFTLAAILALGLECGLSRGTRVARAAIYPLAAAVAALLIYAWNDLVLHPKLTLAITGKPVIFDLQSGVLRELYRKPLKALIGSASVFADTFGYLIGGVSGFLALVAVILLISAWRSEDAGQFRGKRLAWLRSQRAVLRISFADALMLGCLYTMVARLPAVMWTDVSRGYYILPLSMVLFLFLAISVSRIVAKGYLTPALVSFTVVSG